MKRRQALAGLGALAASATSIARAQTASDAPVVFPAITLLDGTVWTSESWQGRAAVVVLWATWCPFCHRHNAHLDALYRSLGTRPLRVLGVALDRDPEVVRRHVAQHGYQFPVAMGGEAWRTAFGLRRVTPTTLTFDRQSRLVQRIPGEMFEEDVMAFTRLAEGAR